MADLGWLLATWRDVGEPELYPSPSGHPGYLGRAEMGGAVCRATGADVSDLPCYVSFSLWRLACIHQGIYARYRSGAMGDDHTVDVEGRPGRCWFSRRPRGRRTRSGFQDEV